MYSVSESNPDATIIVQRFGVIELPTVILYHLKSKLPQSLTVISQSVCMV